MSIVFWKGISGFFLAIRGVPGYYEKKRFSAVPASAFCRGYWKALFFILLQEGTL